jgi:MFS family permease
MEKVQKKSFWALIVTQFFGAFNDNVLKTLVTLLVVAWVDNLHQRNSLVSISGAVFVAPFLIFSMIAGRVSDRLGKPYVIRATKFWELLVIAAAIASLLTESIPWMMVTLFLLSMQATFFSPAKYGVLPELMNDTELPEANALLNLSTFAAILLGTLTAGFLSEQLSWACAVMGLASVAGLTASFFMKPLSASKPEESLGQKPAWLAAGMGFVMVYALLVELHHRHWHGWEISAMVVSLVAIAGCFLIANGPDLLANWQLIQPDRRLRMGTIAVNYFWFMGAVLQLNIFLYAKEIMDVSDRVASLLVMAVAVGVGAGSYVCGKLSRGRVEIRFVFLGALGMSLFAVDLLWAYGSPARAFFDFFMLGAAGGFYDIPLMALIQAKSPEAERGRVMATINFLSFAAILFASGVLWFLSNVLQQNPAQVFYILGVASLAVVSTVYLHKYGLTYFKCV